MTEAKAPCAPSKGPAEISTQTTSRWVTARYVSALADRASVDHHTALIPADDARRIIAEVDGFLGRRATPEDAAALAARLFGSYRSYESASRSAYNDADTFLRELAELFGEYPAALGAAVVKQIIRESKFPPAIAEVATALKNARAIRLGYKYRAQKHIAEAARRVQLADIDRNRASSDDIDVLMTRYRERIPKIMDDDQHR